MELEQVEKAADEKKCETCKFFAATWNSQHKPDNPNQEGWESLSECEEVLNTPGGTCRRYPPSDIRDTDELGDPAGFYPVWTYYWCGEYKPKSPPVPTVQEMRDKLYSLIAEANMLRDRLDAMKDRSKPELDNTSPASAT